MIIAFVSSSKARSVCCCCLVCFYCTDTPMQPARAVLLAPSPWYLSWR